MQKNAAHLFFLAVICCTLSGCGTKGPLYIPEQQYPQDTSTSK
ncbi:MAG: lipoprotein [Methylotenera sp.]|nr:lipoprotein [Methylotenera sp.]